jgi:hypothetical protein
MKKTTITLFLALLPFCLNGQIKERPLTKKEKTEDFMVLFNELKASYPYFGINKRVNKIDWLSNKKRYLKEINNTKTDTAFFDVVMNILNDLNNDHTDAYPTIIYDYFYKGCKEASESVPEFLSYVEELEKTNQSKCNYWKIINSTLYFSDTKNEETDNLEIEENNNIEIGYYDKINTTHLKVKSFSYEYLTEDAKILRQFFNDTKRNSKLIIDIQGNDGGSTEYWLNNIIPYLIKDSLTYPLIYGFKDSEKLRKFKPNYFKNTIPVSELELPNLPPELKNQEYLFRKDFITIAPVQTENIQFSKVFLLVDHEVFSSAEALAYFFKATNFGLVAGTQTNGDGVGTDPILTTLPNSGIVIRYTGEMGLNPDGSANEETKTVPDIILKGENKQQRLNELLKIIPDL